MNIFLVELVLSLCLINSMYGREIRGTLISPGYPGLYPNNVVKHQYLKADRHSFIVVTFRRFHTEVGRNGEHKDYLRVYDGRRADNTAPVYYEGWLDTPFTLVSKTNRLRTLFVSNHANRYRGFYATYTSVDRRTHCNTDTLPSMGMRATSCSGHVHTFATACRVQCLDNFRLVGSNDVTTCSDGAFQSLCREYCDVTALQTNRTRVRSCSRIDGLATECAIQCTENYRMLGDSMARCVDGEFTEVACAPIPQVVRNCEDNEMQGCPYDFEEINDFYESTQLELDADLTDYERREEEDFLRGVLGPDRLVGRSNALVCRRIYCEKKYNARKRRKVYIFSCGKLPGPRKRRACMYCRYKSKCNSPPPRTFFST